MLDIAILIAICVGSSFVAAVGVTRSGYRKHASTERRWALLRGQIQGSLEELDEPELQAVRRMIGALLERRDCQDLPSPHHSAAQSERGA